MDLVVIGDGTENSQVHSLLPSTDIWIGLSDTATEKAFLWVDGSPLGSYAPWSTLPKEPDSLGVLGGPSQDCVLMSTKQVWFDEDCATAGLHDVRGYCCEAP